MISNASSGMDVRVACCVPLLPILTFQKTAVYGGREAVGCGSGKNVSEIRVLQQVGDMVYSNTCCCCILRKVSLLFYRREATEHNRHIAYYFSYFISQLILSDSSFYKVMSLPNPSCVPAHAQGPLHSCAGTRFTLVV